MSTGCTLFPQSGSPIILNKDITRDDESDARLYIRSASKDFVNLLTNLKCTNCMDQTNPPIEEKNKRFSAADPPWIAGCGHYIHEKCASNHDISCLVCSKDESILSTATACQDEKLLGPFFERIAQNGFRCGYCEKLHPKYNSVRLTNKDDVNHESAPKYACLWCIQEKIDGLDKKMKVFVMDEEETAPARQSGEEDLLESIWFGELRDIGSAFMQCCSCAKELEGKGDKLMKCGHTIHDYCLKKQKIYCNFCHESWNRNEVEELKTSHAKEYIKDIPYADYFCVECKYTHPEDNLTQHDLCVLSGKCYWCYTQQKIKDHNNKST